MSNIVEIFSPAKINLLLAVTGRRPDGYHDIVSVAAPVDWGDRLWAESGRTGESLVCSDPGVPVDGTNLVLRATAAFRKATGWDGGVSFRLEKRIPIGAGLGGGSSNGAAALRALERLSGRIAGPAELATIAAEVGSDCALFLNGGPVVMRGRGERIEALPQEAETRLAGRRVFLFKPGFPVATPWAYARLAEKADYLPPAEAEGMLARWVESDEPAEKLLHNAFEQVVFSKFPALPLLLERLRERFGLAHAMSGSGSACFALLPARGAPAFEEVAGAVREAWGAGAFAAEARIGGNIMKNRG